jgi:ATP-dependent Clp protease protease subunit
MTDETVEQEATEKELSKSPLFIDFTRLIQLHGDVCEELSREYQAAILKLHAEDPEAPIFTFLNTHGGDAYEGFAMYDLMKLLPTEKVIISQGKVMSAGLILLAGADLRLSLPSTIFMIHNMATTIPPEMSDPQKIQQGLDSTKEMNENMLHMIKDNCNLNYEQVKQLAQDETYFTAYQALEWGFIDGIIGRKEEPNEATDSESPQLPTDRD